MKATNSWITYRTRFLVKAKQLTASLSFTDALGRPHSGRKGDYLVESSDGVLRIAPRQIFEDIYVPLLAAEDSSPAAIQPLCEELSIPPSSPKRPVTNESLPSPLTRKFPQPVRRMPSLGLRSH
jgi:hypothetical protein